MSYKKAVVISAVGIGAFLQGCSEDEKPEANKACANLLNYFAVEKKGATADADNVEDEGCSACLAAAVGGEATTDLLKWQAALTAGGAATVGSDEFKKPLDALVACGGKAIATTCTDLGDILANKDAASIHAAIVAQSVAVSNADCGMCVAIGGIKVDSACSVYNTALDACGGNIDCDAEYRCLGLDDYVGVTGASAAALPECTECLDASVLGDVDSNTDTFALEYAAGVGFDANFEVLMGALEACGAQRLASSCDGVILTATDLSYDLIVTQVKAVKDDDAPEDNCLVCANLNLAADPTCAESVAAFEECGVDTEAAVCDACSDYAFGADDESCHLCLEAANSGWVVPANPAGSDPTTFVNAMTHMTTCGASDTASTSCPTLALQESFTTASDGSASEFGAVFRTKSDEISTGTGADNACTLCVYYQLAIANADTSGFTCEEWVAAIAACSGTNIHTSTLEC